tara:strand:- start:103 stop:468 length:366 start_codon:yes stop_codon:yes gene_type:complete
MKIRVFFNNSCNICKVEINHYKRICNNNFKWIDITNNKDAEKITTKSNRQLLRRLHVIDKGKVFSGAKAFLIVWKNIPRYKFLYKIFSIKIFFFFFNIFYEIVAYFLFLKNLELNKNNEKK